MISPIDDTPMSMAFPSNFQEHEWEYWWAHYSNMRSALLHKVRRKKIPENLIKTYLVYMKGVHAGYSYWPKDMLLISKNSRDHVGYFMDQGKVYMGPLNFYLKKEVPSHHRLLKSYISELENLIYETECPRMWKVARGCNFYMKGKNSTYDKHHWICMLDFSDHEKCLCNKIKVTYTKK